MYGKLKWTMGFLLLFVYLKENTKLRCGEFGYVDERT